MLRSISFIGKISLMGLVAFTVAPVQAQVLVTSSAGIPAPNLVVDFSQFGAFTFGTGPVQIGGLVGENIVWTSTNASNQGGAVIGNGGYGLSSNGSWNSGRNGFTGINSPNDSMTYTFNSGPVSAVGGFLNYSPGTGGDVVITALDSANAVIASYDITLLAPISTPGGVNAGAFRGIVSPTANIFAFRVSNSYVVLDDLRFNRTSAVPEPGSLALIAGLGVTVSGFALRRLRRRK